MKRILLIALAAGLVLAPAASAKGPHAVLTAPRETVEPGKPWEITIELNEFRHPPHPAVIGRHGGRTVGAKIEKVPSSIDGAAAFRVTMIFPREGRWALRMFAGTRRFRFPAVAVGGARMPQDYVTFPVGSEAARQGAGGVWTTDEAPADSTGGDALPPETVSYTGPAASDDGGGGIGPWILPLLGVVLAGAGVAAVTRRGSR
jgi:hypothetical protein